MDGSGCRRGRLCAPSRDHGSWGHHYANEIAIRLEVLGDDPVITNASEVGEVGEVGE